MKIQNIKIEDIKPYEKNAKKHTKKQIEQVANSIKEFGFNQPVVVDKDNVLIVGHGRLEAAKLLGLKDVPVMMVDLTEDQAKAYRLADNKLNESDWDMELVMEELKGLDDSMVDLTGFDNDLILDNINDEFDLPSGDKEPFQQITFTLADKQSELIKNKIIDGKKLVLECDKFGNENSNGNALYLIVKEWGELKT